MHERPPLCESSITARSTDDDTPRPRPRHRPRHRKRPRAAQHPHRRPRADLRRLLRGARRRARLPDLPPPLLPRARRRAPAPQVDARAPSRGARACALVRMILLARFNKCAFELTPRLAPAPRAPLRSPRSLNAPRALRATMRPRGALRAPRATPPPTISRYIERVWEYLSAGKNLPKDRGNADL